MPETPAVREAGGLCRHDRQRDRVQPSSSAGAHSGETALTGTTLAKVKAAVTANYPNATFDRVETDDGGVYEAHITTAAGDRVTVEVDKSFAITGTV